MGKECLERVTNACGERVQGDTIWAGVGQEGSHHSRMYILAGGGPEGYHIHSCMHADAVMRYCCRIYAEIHIFGTCQLYTLYTIHINALFHTAVLGHAQDQWFFVQ